jgi:hypothetical protein
MTSVRLTALLAERVMGWAVAPDRFLIGKRRWLPRWRFQPLTKVEDAFQLLATIGGTYTLRTTADGTFSAQVRVGNSTGKASGEPTATIITVAVARTIGLDVTDEMMRSFIQNHNRGPRSWTAEAEMR